MSPSLRISTSGAFSFATLPPKPNRLDFPLFPRAGTCDPCGEITTGSYAVQRNIPVTFGVIQDGAVDAGGGVFQFGHHL
jgi:hypothetical protein